MLPGVLLTSRRVPFATSLTLAVAGFVMAGCAGESARPAAAPASRPAVVTISRLQTMLQGGEAPSVILGEIDRSGTVYRLTTEQRAGLRADGMPVSILSRMEMTYANAVAKHPALATSNEQWIAIGDYWYGGLPAGWPPDWLVP